MRAALSLVALALVAGCAPRMPFRPLPPPPDVAYAPPPPTGSLWHAELAGNYPVLDVRAHFPGDLLTVVISETSNGKKDAKTDTKGTSSILASVTAFFGLPIFDFLPSGFKPDPIVEAKTDRSSTGEATTTRAGTLTASITVRVMMVDANGNLYVQGDKIVGVNSEDQHIRLSGTVRPEDIAPDNSVLSSRLADARIDYYGRGTVGDKQGVPFVHRAFDWIWPF